MKNMESRKCIDGTWYDICHGAPGAGFYHCYFEVSICSDRSLLNKVHDWDGYAPGMMGEWITCRVCGLEKRKINPNGYSDKDYEFRNGRELPFHERSSWYSPVPEHLQ